MARPHRTVTGGWQTVDFRRVGPGSFRLPNTPFARLGVVHAVSAAGDALVTIALAKTLFFVSIDQARPKILTYLLLTLAPFTVVSPFVGPLIDRFAASRRWVVVACGVTRSILCLLLVKDIHGSLLLFPEAFALLVFSKAYAIARSSFVPEVVPSATELVRANSRLALIGGLAGFVVAPLGALIGLLGADWVAAVAAIVFLASGVLATRLTTRGVSNVDVRPYLHGSSSPYVNASSSMSPLRTDDDSQRTNSGESERRHQTAMRLATLAMSVQRGLVGLVTFLVAFTFRREGVPNWWLGLVAGAGIGGGLLGSVLAPKLVDRLGEARVLLGSALLVAVVAMLSAFNSGRSEAAIVAGTIGLAAAMSRLAFDAFVQRESREAQRGAAFARLETRFQLSWVLGALIPVAVPISRFVGFLVVAALAGAVVAAIVGGDQSLQKIDRTLAAGAKVWRRPLRPSDGPWVADDDE